MPSPFCPGCRRPVERCACDPEPPEDVLFHQAAEKGFEPLGEDEKAAFAEKAGIFAAVVHGGRR